MKPTNSAVISLASLLVLAVLGWRGADVSMAIVGICGAYVGARAGLKGTGMMAAAKDSSADTQRAIETLKD